jgi:ADP-heptose:LPS heptosyltransferase
LRGVIDLLGKTDPRQLIRLVYHSSGGVGPSTFLQHLCAAWQKPYVCLLGGREPVAWVQYPKQTTLHSIGQLDCCRDRACWKSRVVPLGDRSEQDRSLCSNPRGRIPLCLDRIEPRKVAESILAYA